MVVKVNEETLNAICPYFTMFPLNFPQRILAENARAGQWVADPFCGRGTTNYAARLERLNTLGVDSNPAAVAIAQAKLVACTPDEIVTAAREILEEVHTPTDVPEGEFWEWAYHAEVLNLLCRLREGLLQNCESDARKALRAIIIGSLHGHVLKTTETYFSNQCQRTYSPKPAYAVRFWKKNNMQPPKVNVLGIIEKRAKHFYSRTPQRVDHVVIHGDSRKLNEFKPKFDGIKADWIITSPPYYGMVSYLPDQWLRLWFIGDKPDVNYDKTSQLKQTGVDVFAKELGQVWSSLTAIAKAGTRAVIRFGGLPSVKSKPLSLLEYSLVGTGWQITNVESAGFSSDGRRQAYQQAKKQNPPVEEFDVWAYFKS